MKINIQKITIALLGFMVLTLGVQAQTRVSSNWNDGMYSYKKKDGFSSLEIQYKGDIQVNDADTDVTSVSAGGYLKINQTTFGNKRAIIIEGNSNSEMVRTYYEGRKQKDYGSEGKKWLAEILIQVIRTTGIAAESRANRIYKKGGTNAVLEEIRQIDSNSGKGRYFDILLAKPNVKDLPLIAEKIGSYIGSNSVRSNIFRKNAERFMANENTSKAFFTGISRMTSSSEKGSLLRHILNNYELSEAGYESLFVVARSINSSSEKASVLRAAHTKMPHKATVLNAYANVISVITSNSEKSRVLRDLIRRNSDEGTIKLCLESLRTFTSNTEMGNVLRDASPHLKGSESLIEEYLIAVRRMTSNTEIGSVMIDLLKNQQLKSIESKIAFFETTRRITSNTERARVLRRGVSMLGGNKRVDNAYFDSIKGLTSNTERGSVLREVISMSGITKNTMLNVIDATRTMTSNSEIGNVLVSLSRVMPKTDTDIKDAFKSAASRITSDSEYRRVIESLE